MRTTLILGACLCALASFTAPAFAVAVPSFIGSFYSAADGVSVSGYDAHSPSPSDTHDLWLVRNGVTVASGSGPYRQISLPAGSLQAGDQALLFRNGLQVASFNYDGPTIGADACAGATQFTGAAGPGDLRANAYTPGIGSGTQHNVTITRTAQGFAATVDTPLTTGDGLSVDLSSTTGDTYTDSYAEIKVADCPAGPVTPVPPVPPAPPAPPAPPLPPTTAQLMAGVTSSLGTQSKLLVTLGGAKVLNAGGVTVPTTFLAAGTMGYVWLANAPGQAAAAAKSTTVAKGSLTRSTPGVGKVKVRLTKAGKKLLRRGRPVKLTIRGTFTAVGGKPVVATKHVTLKRRAKKK